MAIFNKKTKAPKVSTKEVSKDVAKTTKKEQVTPSGFSAGNVLVRPHLSEKGLLMGSKNVYAFIITPTSTKRDVEKAIVEVYKVTPIKVNVVNMPGKRAGSRMKGAPGLTKKYRKAYVTLKKGDTLQLI